MSSFLIFFTGFALAAYACLGIILWQVVRMWDHSRFSTWVRNHRWYVLWCYSSFLISIPLLAVLSYGYTITHYTFMTSWIYTIFVWILGASGYFLLGGIISWIGAWVVYLFKRKSYAPDHQREHLKNNMLRLFLFPFHTWYPRTLKYLISLPLVLAIIVVVYGTIHAAHIQVTHYEISASQAPVPLPSSWVGRKIVLVTDTHIGQVRKERFLDRVVTMINEQHPDLVIVGGDLIDGPKFPHEFLEPLRNLKSTLGNYFIEGNHEGYSRDPEIAQVIDTYLTRISDTVLNLDKVSLVGINYYREDLAITQHRIENLQRNHEGLLQNPVLGIIHDPRNVDAFAVLKPFLTLSGHTHNGQMWPGALMVRRIYGSRGYGKSIAPSGFGFHMTSSGVGTAQTPMRIGSRSEIVVITVGE